MTWRLRLAEPADAAALALVAGATFLETYAGMIGAGDMLTHLAAKSSSAVFAGWIADDRHAVVLGEAEQGGAPVGYAALTPPDLPVSLEPGDVELRRIYVLTPWHGRGVGAALLAEAVAAASGMGAGRVLLGVNGRNAQALAFYRRHGFVELGTRRFLVGTTWHDDLVLGRALSGSLKTQAC